MTIGGWVSAGFTDQEMDVFAGLEARDMRSCVLPGALCVREGAYFGNLYERIPAHDRREREEEVPL